MWVFTRYGFYSVACVRNKDGSVDTERVMVRARMREHLESLRERFPETGLGRAEILVDAGTDYLYRLIVDKAEWASVVSQLAMEQTWPGFKSEAARYERRGRGAARYVEALHKVWWTMAKLQE
jgi:hypothetical protein